MERRLAAILVADVVGYSRLMAADEAGTHARLKELREDFVEPTIADHHGRIVKLMGDGLLVEFASVVDAVTCAVAIQQGVIDREAATAETERIALRIGINIGDVISEGDDIYGDGVNMAARLESLAEPGGICISRTAYDHARGKVDVGFEPAGTHQVRNIPEPVEVFRVQLAAESAGRIVDHSKAGAPGRQWAAAAVALVVVVAGGAGLWYHQTKPEFAPASVAEMAYPLPDRPSIAVLPFDNYTDDPQLGFFANGLTEDLTTSLSKEPGLFVVARNSTAAYAGEPVDVKRVAEELGVRYVLEGSVQKAGDELRINAQLIDALDGRHLWADRFDRPAGDVFAVQDEIVKRVFVELQVELTQGAAARVVSRGTDDLDAWLLRLEGYKEFIKFTREGMERARELNESAHETDPDWARPLGALASVHWYEAKQGWSASREDSISMGMELAERAIELDSNEPIGYQALGNLYSLLGDSERAIELRRKAVEVAPNDFIAVGGLATRLKDHGGEHEAVELFERAMRLSPKHPWWVPAGYGLALHLVGRKEDAVEAYEKAIHLKPKNWLPYTWRAAVHADLGQMEEARAAAEEVVRLDPQFSASQFMRAHSLHDDERNAWFQDLLIRAGLPE